MTVTAHLCLYVPYGPLPLSLNLWKLEDFPESDYHDSSVAEGVAYSALTEKCAKDYGDGI